jgi:hypothetical protein
MSATSTGPGWGRKSAEHVLVEGDYADRLADRIPAAVAEQAPKRTHYPHLAPDARPGRTRLRAVRPGHEPSEAPIRAIWPMPAGS